MRFLSSLVLSLVLISRAHSEVLSPIVNRLYRSSELTDTPGDKNLHYVNLSFQGGSELKLSSPERWAPLLGRVGTSLAKIHHELEQLLGELPQITASVRLVDQEYFFQLTEAPKWTNAVYFRGEILIPIKPSSELDLKTFNLSVRHEYTHAVIHALSDGKCPGWLDEGLAQWAEGEHSPVVLPFFRKWLLEHQPLRLELLQNGFTQLEVELASAAYAQSLFAAHQVINIFGFKSIRKFFDGLSQGLDQGVAFERAFLTSERRFQEKLDRALLNEKIRFSYPRTRNS